MYHTHPKFPLPLKIVTTAYALLVFSVALFWHTKTDAIDPDYEEVVSANYRLTPDEENYCYRIYKSDGTPLGGWVEFGNPVLIRDTETGETCLYTRYRDTDAYQVVSVDPELLRDIKQAMGRNTTYAEPLSDYTIKTDAKTRLSYLSETGGDMFAHILLYDETDISRFDNLAKQYADLLAEVIPDGDVGYIYAAYEIRGLSKRYDGGFLFIQDNQIQYIAVKSPEDGWNLSLSRGEYEALSSYLAKDKSPFENPRYESWTPLFDALHIEYDIPLDPESPRYQAALTYLTEIWGSFPAEGMDEKTAEAALKDRMKDFDEDGDRLNFFGIAGMEPNGKDVSAFHVIIPIAEPYRQALFDYEKERFITSYGLSRNDAKKQAIFRDYQLSIEKEDRLKGSWTMNQYDRAYCTALLSIIQSTDRKWELGDEFDTAVLENITREQVERRIKSDGTNLTVAADPVFQKRLNEGRDEMVEWMLR